MKAFWQFSFALTVLASTLAPLHAACDVQVVQQRVEYKTNPIGIDTVQPRLSWQVAAVSPASRSLRQTAYRILVSSSAANLHADNGDLWDSGQVASDETLHIQYRGKPLQSAQACYWKVQVWDQQHQVSKWSPQAEWTMGLLSPEDWTAQWIGYDAEVVADDPITAMMEKQLIFENREWVWTAGAKAGNQPAGQACFRKEIIVPASRSMARATFLVGADDGFNLFVNGEEAGNGSNWRTPALVDVTKYLRAGKNLLAIRVNNVGDTPGPSPAGLIGKLVIAFDSGSPQLEPIDATWASSSNPSEGWQQGGADTGDWAASSVVAKYGDGPWGQLKIGVEKLLPASYLRKTFTVQKPLRRAVLFASALGAYQLHVNGSPLNNDVLSPGWTDYRKRVHYFGYDLTDQLSVGDNALGAILGDGWYASYLAFSGRRHYYGQHTRFVAQLLLQYEDGSEQIVATDDSWKASYGPIRQADLLMGCMYDARRELPGWNTAGGDDSAWSPVTVDAEVQANLQAHPAAPMRVLKELPARRMTQPKPGVYIYDLGQNMVGHVRLTLKGKKGQQVILRHAEMLNPDGTMYTTNLRAAKAIDTYILGSDDERTYEPSFTFHGFQYVEVTGVDTPPAIEDVVGMVVSSDLPRTGEFTCNEPLVNKLVENTVWGQVGNFLDVPTDCPQRDERAGWTGDAQVFMKTACLNLDSPAFFTKWLVDLCQDSQRDDGGFGDVAPHVDVVGFGNTGWADAGIVCNWRMVELYGDTRVVREHYPALLRYMDYLQKTSRDYVRGTGAYGDWLRLAGPQHSDAIGTAYYFYSSDLMSRLADSIGEQEDARQFREMAEAIREVFVRKFIQDDGRIVDDKGETGQTFYALAFGLDLVPESRRQQVSEHFVAEIEKQDGHLATGFLGTPFVLFAMQKAGLTDLAYHVLLQDTYPSWLLQVKLGSTTMWERWDGWLPGKGFQDPGMNSFNHYWLGCVGEWLQCGVAGIDAASPGFKTIRIRPALASAKKGLDSARGSYDSIRGTIVSQWKRDADGFCLDISIPANTTATVFVPTADAAAVREGDDAATKATGIKFLRSENGYAVYEVGSGQYAFTVPSSGTGE